MTEHWARGDFYDLDIPADAAALVTGGEEFLTQAFHASGVLSTANRISRMYGVKAFFGGGTGSKLVVSVAYKEPQADLPEQLFVKFSRNFDEELRDSARFMMVSEVRFAKLSRCDNFPVAVPFCLFADIEAESGTGLMITEHIAFGSDNTEALYPKCMDYTVPDPLLYYKTILQSLARLSGTHKGGGLPAAFDEQFPFNRKQNASAFTIRSSLEKLTNRANRMFAFVRQYPQLFPENILTSAFQQQFLSDIPFVMAAEKQIKTLLCEGDDYIALCHWNANIDNCWFWRNADASLHCGLLDWAMVGQMSVVQTIAGVISGAEKDLWDNHLDELLMVFIDEYAACGGPWLNLDELRYRLLLLTAITGLSYGMSAPLAIGREISDLSSVQSYQDSCFRENENSRIQLHMMTKMLNVWQTRNLGSLVRQLVN